MKTNHDLEINIIIFVSEKPRNRIPNIYHPDLSVSEIECITSAVHSGDFTELITLWRQILVQNGCRMKYAFHILTFSVYLNT